ncbi:MAG: acyltransferase [Cyanobacteria bacterium J06639_1]
MTVHIHPEASNVTAEIAASQSGAATVIERSSPELERLQRLLGIDLWRGIAAYAVILVHSGDRTWGVPVDDAATTFRLAFYFAVPFFLAAAFFFMVKKPEVGRSGQFWRSRVERLAIPYLMWSVFYVVLRSARAYLGAGVKAVKSYLDDPLALLFFGGASYHLYFLPLLFVGTLSILAVCWLDRRRSPLTFAGLSLVFLILSQLTFSSGNGFQLGAYVAFESLFSRGFGATTAQPFPIRLVLVCVAWLLRCLPYAFMAKALDRLLVEKGLAWVSRPRMALAGFFTFGVANALGSDLLPREVRALCMAFGLLVFSLSISRYLNRFSDLIVSVGRCSFGIYLAHPIVMNLVKPAISKLGLGLSDRVSIASMLWISLSSFVLSWLAVLMVAKVKPISKYVVGI